MKRWVLGLWLCLGSVGLGWASDWSTVELPDGDGLAGWSRRPFSGSVSLEAVGEPLGGGVAVVVSDAELVQPDLGQFVPFQLTRLLSAGRTGRLIEIEAELRSREGRGEIRLELLGPGGETLLVRRAAATESTWSRGSLRCWVPRDAEALRVVLEQVGRGELGVRALRYRFSPLTAPAGLNLVGEPGFERGGRSWDRFGDAAEFRFSTEAARSGRYGGSIVVEGSSRQLSNLGQEVLLPELEEEPLHLEAWVRPRGLTGRAFLGVFFYGVARSDEGLAPFSKFVPLTENHVTGSGDWTRLSRDVLPRGVTLYGAWIRVCVEGGGRLDVDDVWFSIQPAPSPSVLPPLVALALILAFGVYLAANRREASR